MTLCAERARGEGHSVFAAVGESPSSAVLRREVGRASLIVLPYPATRDGVFINATRLPFSDLPLSEGATVVGGGIPADWHREHILFCDLVRDERLLWQNARLTAEGVLAAALSATERGLYGVAVAVLGYGRIGKQLARLAACLGAQVTVYARREVAIAEAEAAGHRVCSLASATRFGEAVVFSTLPPSADVLPILSPRALCYDLGGALPNALPDGEGGSISVESARGVPGIFAPVGAAEVYYEALRPYLSAEGTAGEESFPTESVVPTAAMGEGRWFL